ncbi:MAG: YraN family protein [Methylohalobius sp.]|nr:YraN family protein [Methylohalobius sp.]
MTNRHLLGRQAEEHALFFLKRHGLRLLARNYRSRFGEIDLILLDESVLVFAEVRCRANPRFGGALESITSGKQKRLLQTAQHYLSRHPYDGPIRFDVLALTPTSWGFDLEWIRNAF